MPDVNVPTNVRESIFRYFRDRETGTRWAAGTHRNLRHRNYKEGAVPELHCAWGPAQSGGEHLPGSSILDIESRIHNYGPHAFLFSGWPLSVGNGGNAASYCAQMRVFFGGRNATRFSEISLVRQEELVIHPGEQITTRISRPLTRETKLVAICFDPVLDPLPLGLIDEGNRKTAVLKMVAMISGTVLPGGASG